MSLAVVGVVSILGSIELEEVSRRWSQATSELGIAFIIASLLTLAVEGYLKEQLFEEIDDHVRDQLTAFQVNAFDLQKFGSLPALLQTRIRQNILQQPIIAENFSQRYLFVADTVDSEEVYRVQISTDITYRNLSGNDESFQVRLPLPKYELFEERKDYGFSSVVSKIDGGGKFPEKLDRETMRRMINSIADETWFSNPAELAPHASLTIHFEGIAYLSLDDWVATEALMPTINMSCTAKGLDLIFYANPGESVTDLWAPVDDADTEARRWTINGAVLPGQGFELRWVKAEDD